MMWRGPFLDHLVYLQIRSSGSRAYNKYWRLSPEHVLRKIQDCTFRPKYFLRDFLYPKSPENFISSLKNSDGLFWSSTTIRGIFVFFLLFPTFHEITPYFFQNSVKIFHLIHQLLMTFFSHQRQIGLPLIHHCKNSLPSLHISVHHCTFCASLHVKTSPDY